MAEEDDLGDLYGDLEDDTTVKNRSTSPSTQVASASGASSMAIKVLPSLKAPPPSSMAQLTQIEEKVKALEAENMTLKRNMGMLYRTARREIERKDRQISELMAELDNNKNS